MGILMNRSLYIVVAMIIATACSQLDLPEGSHDEHCSTVQMIIPEMGDFDGADTKSDANLSSTGVSFVWAEKDTVGIFPEAGSQIYFSMADGVGESSAVFDGGGWALKKSARYFSYFPFVGSFYIDKTAVPLTFEGQSQIGNGSMTQAAVGKYNYMVAEGDYNESTGNLAFSYQFLSSLFRFRIPVDAATYTRMTFSAASECIVESGTFNAMALDCAINDPVYVDCLTLDLKDVELTDGATFVGFMMIPPFNYLNEQITVSLTKSDGSILTSSVPGKNYRRGTPYDNAPNFSIYPASASLSGAGESTTLKIITSKSTSYEVSTDVDWLTLGSAPSSGSASVTVTASTNPGAPRKGHVIVSETVNGVTLRNIMTVSQTINGMDVGVRDWETGDDEGGSVG